MAASLGHVEVVKMLLSGGADATLKTSKGWTSRVLAAALDKKEVVAALDAHAKQ